MIPVTHQGFTGTLENVAHVLTGTRLWVVPTDESKMVSMFDTLGMGAKDKLASEAWDSCGTL